MTVKVSQYFGFFAFLMAIVCLLSGCSDDDSTPREAAKDEIRFNVDVWRMIEGTRVATFEPGTLTSGSFTAAAYFANSTTEYVSPVQVNWITDKWVFSDGKHTWPASGSLDFFAYMPTATSLASNAPYITSGPTYAVNGTPAPAPYFVCTNLAMTYQNAYTDDESVDHAEEGQGSSLQEFVYALEMGQDKEHQGESGVTLTFRHPFARIKFQLSASHPEIQINSITFKALKSGGTCTLGGSTSTWSLLTPEDNTVDFVVTLKGSGSHFDNHANSSPMAIGPTFLMVPQTFAGDIEVNATWTEWGEQFVHTVSTKLDAITWQAGYSYTYTFTVTETDLKVDTSKFTEQW